MLDDNKSKVHWAIIGLMFAVCLFFFFANEKLTEENRRLSTSHRTLYIKYREEKTLANQRATELQQTKEEYDSLYLIFLREKEKKEDYRDAMLQRDALLESCDRKNRCLKKQILGAFK